MMQGDQYAIPLQLTMNGELVTGEAVDNVEVMFGNLRKTIKDKMVSYDALSEAFLIYLTQEETFRLSGGVRAKVRCKFLSGDVIGVDLGIVNVESSASKVVL